MGGFHIAEALRIPYYRAFTMTWSRTRAYPHAFAVPEKKMGGGYNYMVRALACRSLYNDLHIHSLVICDVRSSVLESNIGADQSLETRRFASPANKP